MNIYKGKVLVVDDERGFQELLAYELGSRGYEVFTAGDGESALEKAREKAVDVVISDLAMPRRGGLDVLSVLKEIDPAVQVIVVTGYATPENAVESMKRGAYDFIMKPFQIDDLAALVEKALRKRLAGGEKK